jgi:hypothetical protein
MPQMGEDPADRDAAGERSNESLEPAGGRQ